MAEPLTQEECAKWKTHIRVIADMHANPDVNEPYNDITVNLGTELRLFATLDDLHNQLEGKQQAFKTLQKAHASLVDQLQESRRVEGALANALRTYCHHHETCYRYRWGTAHTKESDCGCGIYAALKLTDL